MSRDDDWRTAPEPTRKEREIASLLPDARRQYEDGFLTLREALNVSRGLAPNGRPRAERPKQ